MPGLRRCPWSQLTDETWAAVSWWRQWKEINALPYGGDDIMAQPAYVLEVIQQCEEINNRVTAEAHEKHCTEMERQSRQTANANKLR